MKNFLPVALVLVALSSGCTIPGLGLEIPGLPDIPGLGGPTVVQYEHDIIIIKSLEAVPNEIDSGQTAKILAYIENRGDKTVNGVEVDLYDYCKGLFTPKVITCPGQATLDVQDQTKCVIDRMLPGEIVPVIWTVCQNRADPVKVRTVCPSDGMKMLVRYPYSTTSLTTISLISLEEMQRELIERTYASEESYIAVGQGPIKPYLTVEDKQPVPVFDILPGSSSTNENVLNARTVLKLQMKNMGSGQLDTKVTDPKTGKTVIAISGSSVVVRGIGSTEDLRPVTPSSKQDEEDVTCIFAEDGSGSTGGKADWDDEIIRFVGKETSPYYCKVQLSHLKPIVGKTTSRIVRVDVDYSYVLTKNVMLTIDPKIVG